MKIIGIDPGSERSGVALVDTAKNQLICGSRPNVSLKSSAFYRDDADTGTKRRSMERAARMADAVLAEVEAFAVTYGPPDRIVVEMPTERSSSGGGRKNRGISVAVYGAVCALVWDRVTKWAEPRGIRCDDVAVECWGRAKKESRAEWLCMTLDGYQRKDDDGALSIADAAGIALYAGQRAQLEGKVVG